MTAPVRSGIPDARKQLASLPLAVVLLAPGMRIADANPLAEQFFGQGARLLARHAFTDIVSFADTRMIERLADAEAPLSVREADIVVRGLGARSVDITTAPVADCPGWQMMTIQDNSAFEALGEDSGGSDNLFLRGPEILAHEIRNPLAGIRGAAQLVARKLNDKDRALTDLITAEVDRVAGLIERMQMLSGKTVPPVIACNLHEIVRRAIAVIEAGSPQGQPRIAIREEFDPSLPPVLGEPDGLVQVLLNLLAQRARSLRRAGRGFNRSAHPFFQRAATPGGRGSRAGAPSDRDPHQRQRTRRSRFDARAPVRTVRHQQEKRARPRPCGGAQAGARHERAHQPRARRSPGTDPFPHSPADGA